MFPKIPGFDDHGFDQRFSDTVSAAKTSIIGSLVVKLLLGGGFIALAFYAIHTFAH